MRDGRPDGRKPNENDVQSQADKKSEDLIGQNLRQVYNQVVDEPLPDQFKALLEKLKSEERK